MVSLDILKSGLENWNINFNEEKIEKFYDFYVLLKEQNEFMNLTTNTDIDVVQRKHFLDSLFFLPCCKPEAGSKIMDLGTGAGFPGVPIAIMCNDFSLTLLDSSNKRMEFVYRVVEALKLNNVNIICDRAETVGHNSGFRDQFDFCLSRAVAPLNVLAEYCLPFVSLGGIFVAYKGQAVYSEIESAKQGIELLGGKCYGDFSYSLSDNVNQRNLLLVKKVAFTPEKYPRRTGIPCKRPL